MYKERHRNVRAGFKKAFGISEGIHPKTENNLQTHATPAVSSSAAFIVIIKITHCQMKLTLCGYDLDRLSRCCCANYVWVLFWMSDLECRIRVCSLSGCAEFLDRVKK